MHFVSSRRLTGPNLDTLEAAAAAEINVDDAADDDVSRFVRLWTQELAPLCERFGLGTPQTTARPYEGGLSLTLVAPIDQLYAAIDLNDYAIERALGLLDSSAAAIEDAERIAALQRAFAKEKNPELLDLEAKAAADGVPFLWDDDFVSVGYGKHAQTWPVDELPVLDSVNWENAKAIPVALITGTNGKTTSSRMLTRIAKMAGYTPGNTSSDGVCVNEEVLEDGDWTGPGAARMVLRHPEVDFAVLETARGGILRRGLGVPRADVALVTNVSDDHLGEGGITSVEAMAQVKAVVGTVVPAEGQVVLCSDDEFLTKLDTQALFSAPVVWFGFNAEAPVIAEHLRAGGEAWLYEDEHMVHKIGDRASRLLRGADIPASFAGAARHNIVNALGAAAAASAVGIDDATIAKALRTFGAKRGDNPGRADLRIVKGVRLLLDFGHNPHGLDAILELTRNLLEAKPGRLFIATGQAGDRSDDDIRRLCQCIVRAEPYRIYVREMRGYLRGRAPGAMTELFREYFGNLGRTMQVEAGEAEIIRDAMAEAKPGDLILITVHMERDAVEDLLLTLERDP